MLNQRRPRCDPTSALRGTKTRRVECTPSHSRERFSRALPSGHPRRSSDATTSRSGQPARSATSTFASTPSSTTSAPRRGRGDAGCAGLGLWCRELWRRLRRGWWILDKRSVRCPIYISQPISTFTNRTGWGGDYAGSYNLTHMNVASLSTSGAFSGIRELPGLDSFRISRSFFEICFRCQWPKTSYPLAPLEALPSETTRR